MTTDNNSHIVEQGDSRYRGSYINIYDAMKAVPDPCSGDYIIILGVKHYWNENRQSWGILVNQEDQLHQMVEDYVGTLKDYGYQYVSKAEKETIPIDHPNVYYFASTDGRYQNFDNISVRKGEIAVLKHNKNGWEKESISSNDVLLKGNVTIGENGNWWVWNILKLRYEDTGFSAIGKGETGNSPILRWYNNRLQQSIDNGKTWMDLSDPFGDMCAKIEFENPSNGISYGETIKVICHVVNGVGIDITDKYSNWTIRRETDNSIEDDIWNESAKAKEFKGTIELTWSGDTDDIGTEHSAIFTVTAQRVDEEPITDAFEI